MNYIFKGDVQVWTAKEYYSNISLSRFSLTDEARTVVLVKIVSVLFSSSCAICSAYNVSVLCCSGLEEDPRAFWWVVLGSIGTTFATGTFLVFLVRTWPRVIDRRRAQVSEAQPYPYLS